MSSVLFFIATIGVLAPLDKMSASLTLKFTGLAGRQSVTSFAGGLEDALLMTDSLLSSEEPADLTATGKLAGEAPLEIKAIV